MIRQLADETRYLPPTRQIFSWLQTYYIQAHERAFQQQFQRERSSFFIITQVLSLRPALVIFIN